MKRSMQYLVVAGLSLVLAACGTLLGLIPDQPVDDAFGLDGASLTVGEVSDTDVTTLTLSQATGAVSVSVDGDLLARLPAMVRDAVEAATISDTLTVQPAVQALAPGNVAFAPSYTVTGIAVELEVLRGATSVLSRTWTNEVDFTLTGVSAFDGENTVGVFATPIDVPLVELELTGAQARSYFDLLKAGERFTVAATLTLDIEPALPEGAAMTFVLKSLGGDLTF